MIRETIIANLRQLKSVLIQLSDAHFTHKLSVLNYSTIGMHIRHIIEFYQCLMEGIETKVVDYDSRKRNIELETQSQKCIDAIHAIIAIIEQDHRDFSMQLKANYTLDKAEDAITLQTTFYRELLYNIEHTVHHMAIIKIGIKSLENITIYMEEDFGVAVSTLRNNTVCAQ